MMRRSILLVPDPCQPRLRETAAMPRSRSEVLAWVAFFIYLAVGTIIGAIELTQYFARQTLRTNACRVTPGMALADVERIFERPADYKRCDDAQILPGVIRRRTTRFWRANTTVIQVRFNGDDRVVSILELDFGRSLLESIVDAFRLE
jgi:hypothetical protein